MQESPGRLAVSDPDGNEELRGWAEAVSDMHYTGSLVLYKAKLFLPGEQVEAASRAWTETTPQFVQIIRALDPGVAMVAGDLPKITAQNLDEAKLNRASGKQKRGFLGWLRDNFLGLLWSEPPTDDKQRRASEAAERHLDVGAVALDSLGAMPGFGAICKISQEGLLGLKNLLEVRRSRGY